MPLAIIDQIDGPRSGTGPLNALSNSFAISKRPATSNTKPGPAPTLKAQGPESEIIYTESVECGKVGGKNIIH